MITVILLGCDKTGKSTLAKEFQQQLHNSKLIHFNKPKKGEDMYLGYMKALMGTKKNLILDRFYPCENVYGPIYRGKSQMTQQKERKLTLKLLERNAIII